MNIKATNKYLSEKVGTTVFSCQPHNWPKLWYQGSFQSCNVFVWTSGDLVVCVRNSSHRSFVPCYGYFENTLWRKVTCPVPLVRSLASSAHSESQTNTGGWYTKKLWKVLPTLHYIFWGKKSLSLPHKYIYFTNPVRMIQGISHFQECDQSVTQNFE